MTLHVKDGGTWKVAELYVRDGGTWKIVDGSVRDGGTWKSFVSAGVVTLTAQTGANQATGNSTGTALWVFRADGTVDKVENTTTTQVNSSTNWIIPNSAASSGYELKWTQVSGDAPTGGTGLPTVNTWVSMGSDIAIGAWAGFGQYETGIITVYIRYNGGATLASANFEWEGIETS